MTQRQTGYEVTSKLDEMRKAILEEREARAAACWAEIRQVLEKHKCTLDAIPQFNGTGGVFSVTVLIRVTAQD